MTTPAQDLWFQERCGFERMGLKGPRAAEWLANRGLPIPARFNSYVLVSDTRLLVVRLGASEFLLEAAHRVAEIRTALGCSLPGVYPVLREDAAFELGGRDVHEALTQVCNVDFAALDLAARPAVMTLMAGVAVQVIPTEVDGARRYWIWCDPSFGAYLRETLETVVGECGGKVLGTTASRPDSRPLSPTVNRISQGSAT
jgi:sarcosine oxidase subunit gamma